MAGPDYILVNKRLPTIGSAGSATYTLGNLTSTNCTAFKLSDIKVTADATYTALTASHCTISIKTLDATGASTTIASGTLGTAASGFMGDITLNQFTSIPFNSGMSTKVITVGNGCGLVAYVNNAAQTGATGPTTPTISLNVIPVNVV